MAGSWLVPAMGREVSSVGDLTAFRLSHTAWVSKAPGLQYAGKGFYSTFSSLLVGEVFSLPQAKESGGGF